MLLDFWKIWSVYNQAQIARCLHSNDPSHTYVRTKLAYLPWQQGSWGQHGAHLGPTGPRWAPCWPHELCSLGGRRSKNVYELASLGALKSSLLNKLHIFQCMGKIFCVECQRVPLKFHAEYMMTCESNKSIFIKETVCENVVIKVVAILFRPNVLHLPWELTDVTWPRPISLFLML